LVVEGIGVEEMNLSVGTMRDELHLGLIRMIFAAW
jgi:hypothetical protein